MKIEDISIPCDEINLEGILHLPVGGTIHPVSIICHPHPLFGGDMNNNVVLAICQALVSQSIAVLRFNFRGVGESGGKFGGGVKEQEDVKAALDYLSTRLDIDTGSIGLVGYSFGGAVAFPVAQEDVRIKKLVLVSPALNENGWDEIKNYANPKLILLGDADNIVSYPRLQKYFKEDKQFQTVTGADHFWFGFEEAIGKMVVGFFKQIG